MSGSRWHGASQFEIFAFKTRTPEGLCICIVRGNKCLRLQIHRDRSVTSKKGGHENTVPAAMPPQTSPKDTRVQIKQENKLLSNVFPTTQWCAGRNGTVTLFKSESDCCLVPAAGADKHAAASTLESSHFLPAVLNFLVTGVQKKKH